MNHPKAKPRPLAGGAGVRTYDFTGKQVELPYRSENQTRKGVSFIDQLRALANGLPVDGFEHFYGRHPPPGKWWSPIGEGCHHYVRSVRRRRRS